MTRSNRFVLWWLGRQGVPALGFVAVLALLLVLLYDPTNVSPLWTNLRQYTGIIVWLVAMLLPATLYMSGLPMAAASRESMVAACSRVRVPSGSNRPSPTPVTTPRPAIFSTFSSVVSVKATRPLISVPLTVSYRSTARAQNSARVMDWV